jgi:N-acetylglucosaminyl-diphospho-decaprenol L-rhamnosyltransferase
MSFTVVTVLHDSADEVERLLRSLHRHLPDRPQVVAVDTDSADDGAARAAALGAEVLALGANPGFGAACNAGVARARHDVTMLLNPDIEALDDGLARLAAMARGRPVLLAPRLLDPDGSVQRSAHPRPPALLPVLLPPRAMPRRLREHYEPWRAQRPRPVGWAIAAALAAPTAVLRALGPFDPEAFLFYEDLDLGLRAPTELRPDVVLRHAGQHATRRLPERERMQARRRREVVGARLGRRARHLDDVAQALTFALRAAVGRHRSLNAQRLRAMIDA